jgi:ribosomal protein S15P/S13E
VRKKGERMNDLKHQLMIPAAMKFQVAMIGRVDDTCRMEKEELQPHPLFDFALTARFNWSKNVREEKESPNQILLASRDWKTCVFLSLAIYLEVCFEKGLGLHHQYLLGASANSDSNSALYSSALSKCWEHRDFCKRKSGPIGTHSLRKYAATRARESGANKDDIDGRGRWKMKRVSDDYVAIELPFPDAKVCGLLCVNGPVMYCLRNNSGVSREWLLNHVVRNIVQSGAIEENVALRLSLALLWGAMENEVDLVPSGLKNRICEAYNQLISNQVQDRTWTNPVQKIILFIHGEEDQLRITPLQDIDTGATGIHAAPQGSGPLSQEQFQLLYARIENVSQSLEQHQQQTHHLFRLLDDHITKISKNLIQLAAQPVIVSPRQNATAHVKFSIKTQRLNNTLYVENSVDVSTEEVY